MKHITSNRITEGRRDGRTRRGFSLIELTLVVAIIGILSAIAVPRYANAVAHYRVDAAARRIVSDLTLARTEARAQSAKRVVTFTAGATSYTINDTTSPTPYRSTELADAPFYLASVTASFGSGSNVTFDGFGVADNGGSVQVQSGSYSKTVVLDVTTGEASVQ